MNKDKIIKDLKKRNDKLAEQYRLRDIRCVHLEIENQSLQAEVKTFKSDFEAQAELSLKQQQELDKYKNIVDKLEKWLENEIKKSDLKGCSFEQTYITGKWNAYKKALNKLKELKGE